MATRHALPYYAPAETLPAPIPTVAEILASTTRLSAYYEAVVVRVGEHYAVKYSQFTQLQEGENMLFIRESSNVPIPTLYAMFHDEETNFNFLVMEYIPGRNLEAVWAKLRATEKRAITSQLRRAMDELRTIPSPGYYGGIWRQPTRDFLFRSVEVLGSPHLDSTISGPQETDGQRTAAMWRCLDTRDIAESARVQLPTIRRQYHKLFKGHKPVFTHANFLARNVLLREDGTVIIIDWEAAGWYPSYWEHCSAMLVLKYYDDWGQWVHKILDEYLSELGWMMFHKTLLEF